MGLTNPENQMFDGDIDLSSTRKKRFRVNGNNNLVLELDTADLNTIVRLKDNYPKLLKMANKVMSLKEKKEESPEEEINRLADTIKSIDDDMRQAVDNIFDSNVSEVCAANGSMYDLFNGKFRFEHIIEKLATLYGNNMTNELKAVKQRIQKHTKKYGR